MFTYKPEKITNPIHLEKGFFSIVDQDSENYTIEVNYKLSQIDYFNRIVFFYCRSR